LQANRTDGLQNHLVSVLVAGIREYFTVTAANATSSSDLLLALFIQPSHTEFVFAGSTNSRAIPWFPEVYARNGKSQIESKG
jgi:hypothetical protein